MKKVLSLFSIIALLTACYSSEKPENSEAESSKIETSEEANEEESEEANIQFIAIDSDEVLIATALMAAPAQSRMGCTVIGYNMAGEFVTLREGDNEFICLADNPNQEGFSAACYHKDLEPFMARGRELRAQGMNSQEVFNIREEEIKSGALAMAPAGSTLHIYYGSESLYNPETSEVSGAKYRYVVYLPWASSETTGLPESPTASNHPWIMNPGTHKAHIMITPLSEGE